jgi:hypothetical protein
MVQFPSGMDFIALGLDARQSVLHHCGDDTYRGRFFFRSHDHWAEFWHVRGPRKCYTSLARFERAAGLPVARHYLAGHGGPSQLPAILAVPAPATKV